MPSSGNRLKAAKVYTLKGGRLGTWQISIRVLKKKGRSHGGEARAKASREANNISVFQYIFPTVTTIYPFRIIKRVTINTQFLLQTSDGGLETGETDAQQFRPLSSGQHLAHRLPCSSALAHGQRQNTGPGATHWAAHPALPTPALPSGVGDCAGVPSALLSLSVRRR